MTKYILKRLAQTIVILLIISIISFSIIHLVPGDPVYAMLGMEISLERHEQVWREMNLDKPLVVQYLIWVTNILKGDFGYSYNLRQSLVKVIGNKLPYTFYLGILAGLVSILIGIPLGIITAIKRGKLADNVLTVLANIGMATPTFWLGILLVSIFALRLKWLPTYGFTLPWVDFKKSLSQAVMPVICMSVGGIASYTRQTRSSMLEVIRQDYIRTARSKGLGERYIIRKHALKNALIPILTLMGMTLRNTIAGSAVIESVFNIPGIGNLMVQSINLRDYNAVSISILMVSTMTCLCNLLVDIAYAYADPRIRLE